MATVDGNLGRSLFRAMKKGADGRPMVEPTARGLGVRAGEDILVDVNGDVHPESGGMSVTPDDPMGLQRHRRPQSLAGSGRDPVWAIPVGKLSGDTAYRQDSPEHGVVEPARKMSIEEFQQSLSATAPEWVMYCE